jgi:uncharacterized protein (TIGR02453 family)
MTKSTFPGLPAEALTFFRELDKNNNRDWFEANKSRYLELVKTPVETFAAAIAAGLTRIAPAYATEPRRAVYRIYRDTRFSTDKTPYKTNAGALFFQAALGKNEASGLYVEISHRHVGVAGGVYMPGPDHLRLIRAHLMEHHERFLKLIRSRSLVALIGELQGDALTRPPKGFPPDHPANEWIKRKQWYYWRELDAALATTPKLVPEVLKRFEKMLPVVEFFNEPLLAQRKRLAPLITDL